MKNKKDEYVAILTIKELGLNKKRLIKWLRDVAETISSSDPKDYAKSTRFRLMK